MQENDNEPNLIDAIRSGDPRRALIGLRDHIARELDGERCTKCLMSHLKAGDQASLILRLQQILKELEQYPSEQQQAEAAAKSGGKVRSLDAIRGNRNAVATGEERELGTKKAQRRRGVKPS
jgi:hypothetical protein